jgi:hypothetical protein
MVRVVAFYVTFNNISVISWLSVLLVEETGENHCVTDKLYHIILNKIIYIDNRALIKYTCSLSLHFMYLFYRKLFCWILLSPRADN